MAEISTEAILLRALAARLSGELPDRFAKDIADLVTEVRRLRQEQPTTADPDPETHAVTGTHHQAGVVQRYTGRRAPIGFHLTKEN